MNNKKIKIIYLITGLNVGGAESLLRDLLININKDKFEPIIITILNEGFFEDILLKNNIKIYNLKKENKFNNFVFLLIRLSKILKKEKPDILQTSLFHADILGRIAGRINKTPIIISRLGNVYFGGKLKEFLLAITSILVDKFIAISEVVANYAIDNKIASKNKISIIHNSVNCKFFLSQNYSFNKKIEKDFNLSKDSFVFISVGRLVEQKGFIYLLKAFKILNDKFGSNNDFRLFIIGEGEKRKELENFIKKNNLSNKIYLPGIYENIEDYFSIADVFVMSSLWEGFSIAVVEAMAFSLPIITTNVGIIPEILKEINNLIVVPEKNSNSLSKKMHYIHSLSNEKRKNIAFRVRNLILDKFSTQKTVKKYEEFYDGCFN